MNQFHKVLIMGLLLGTSFPVSKFAIAALGVWPFRMISTSSALLGLAIVFRKDVRTFLQGKIDRRAVATLALLGVPNIFLVPTLNSYALSLTSSSNALILVYVMPALLSVMQMVADRRARTDSIIASLLSVSAIALLLKSIDVGVGEVLILLSATVWAVGTFYAGRLGNHFTPAITTFVQYLTSFTLVTFCFAFSSDSAGTALHAPTLAPLLLPVALAIYVGFIANAIVFHLWFELIREKGAEFVAYSALISLMFGMITSVVLFHEAMSGAMVISLLLILSSVYIVQCRKKPVRTSMQVHAPNDNPA